MREACISLNPQPMTAQPIANFSVKEKDEASLSDGFRQDSLDAFIPRFAGIEGFFIFRNLVKLPRWSLNRKTFISPALCNHNRSAKFFGANLKDQQMKKLVSCLFAGLFVLPALLCASDTNDVVSSGSSDTNQIASFPEITITATRISTLPQNTSSSATVISSDEIARSQQQLVADVLRGEPGIDIVPDRPARIADRRLPARCEQ
jgi:hypothetical protein